MMPSDDTVYLDYAATSAIRPECVARAMADYVRDNGATAGRGGHRRAVAAGRVALRCRQAIARVLGLPGDPGRVAFMLNATHALNAALFGTLEPGDAVVVTTFDHNAVLRPVHRLRERHGIEVRHVPGDASGTLDATAFDRAIDGARLVVLNAASNVLGTRLDVAGLTRRAHAAGAMVLVDGAQAVGHVPFPADAGGADMLAFSGHKGLLGPQGVGALWVRENVDVEPLLTGGTGGDSLDPDMPDAWPDHLEAGTTNGPGIAGWLAALEWLEQEGVARTHARTAALKADLRTGLAAIDGVNVHSPPAPEGVPIVTITSRRVDPSTLASRLDRDFGVLTRPGLHCAPDVHRMLGTERHGAVRFSLGWASRPEDVERAIRAVSVVHAAGGARARATSP